jgi:hypothetical protein
VKLDGSTPCGIENTKSIVGTGFDGVADPPDRLGGDVNGVGLPVERSA